MVEKERVVEWLNNPTNKDALQIETGVNFDTGFGLDRTGNRYVDVKKVETILVKSSNGFKVKTSYPKIKVKGD